MEPRQAPPEGSGPGLVQLVLERPQEAAQWAERVPASAGQRGPQGWSPGPRIRVPRALIGSVLGPFY